LPLFYVTKTSLASVVITKSHNSSQWALQDVSFVSSLDSLLGRINRYKPENGGKGGEQIDDGYNITNLIMR
jgi:hypothetical protein